MASANAHEYIVVTTAAPDLDVAREIAHALVSENLAASVQILGPIESHYWWQDECRETEEYLCLAKTRLDFYDEVEDTICSVHPYETPEIIATPIARGSLEFLAWITRHTRR